MYYLCGRIGFPEAGIAGRGIKRETGERPVQFPLLYAPPPRGGIAERLSLTTGPAGSGRRRRRSESEDLPIRNPAHGICGERIRATQGLIRVWKFWPDRLWTEALPQRAFMCMCLTAMCIGCAAGRVEQFFVRAQA